MSENNCWSCFHLEATVGGWHCVEHNVFLHEQTKKNDVGRGGNGCDFFNVKRVLLPINIKMINVDIAFDLRDMEK